VDPAKQTGTFRSFKSFSITEKFKGQFRTGLLNAFNTPLFNAPGTSYGSGSFGVISSQGNFSRMLELGVRLFFQLCMLKLEWIADAS
jgi:hypothetical protein